MDKLKDLVEGKKTYLIVAAVLVLGTLQGLDIFCLPEGAWLILGGLGLGFLRSGVKEIAKEIKKINK